MFKLITFVVVVVAALTAVASDAKASGASARAVDARASRGNDARASGAIPSGDVCFHGQTIHLVGRDAVADFLENPAHRGATLGACTGGVINPTSGGGGIPAVAGPGAIVHVDGNAWLCTPANGPQPYLLDAALVRAALAGGSRYANQLPYGLGPQPNAKNTASFNCVVPAGLHQTAGVVADNNGWLYPVSYQDYGTIGYPVFTS